MSKNNQHFLKNWNPLAESEQNGYFFVICICFCERKRRMVSDKKEFIIVM
jgi:hypothetical protein